MAQKYKTTSTSKHVNKTTLIEVSTDGEKSCTQTRVNTVNKAQDNCFVLQNYCKLDKKPAFSVYRVCTQH